MSKEMVIGSNRHETKVAVLEDDQVVEVYFQRGNEYSLAGSVHKGRVTRVLPGMQSAFVDVGLERDTFLYVSDFFEEQEDLDTVADEKPARAEGRDRNGGRGRGPERQAAESLPEAAPVVRPVIVPTVREEQELPELKSDAAPPVVREAADQPAARSADPAGDRNDFRGGDRRGRRSRRRRTRGRGFPETKYAQPGAFSSRTEPAPAARPDDDGEESETAEVILLPGESLAKYRGQPAPARAVISSESARPPEPETTYADAGGDSEAGAEHAHEEAREIEAEAEELELAEKILAHHDDESPEDVEEKIAEVRQDVPAADEAETWASPPQAGEAIDSIAIFPAPGSIGAAGPASWGTRVEPLGPADFEEFEVIALEEARGEESARRLDTVSEALDDAEAGVPEEEAGVPDEIEAGGDLEAPGGETPAATGEAGAQTAFVREQGGRSMHRVSRRMRRRRGGNRFGAAPAQDAAPKTKPPFVEFAGATGPATGAAAVAYEPETRPEPRGEASEERSAPKPERTYPSISDLLKAGQEIIVQIAKEPLGQKGARITSHIALPGRYVVFMPSVTHLGVSRKVASDEERQRLKRILQSRRPGPTGGFIVRTAGEGVPEDEIAADMNFLYTLWQDIRQKAEKKPAPALLHYDLDIVQRILRDQVTEEFKAIWVDNEDLYESVVNFMQRFQPALVNRVKMYTRSAPIFDAFNITQELEKALRPKVWLKSGGYIVINQTEALVAIDINTGKYVGKSNRLEDTIVKTNTEAVKEIVRQIRLRDLGGIIVVDFIDMDERKNRQKVMQALEEAMRADKAPYKILQFNDFGLVAITRKRVKQSLERTLCMPCPYCEGAGYVKSVQTVISEILVEAQKIARAIEGKDVVLRVHPDVAKVLKSSSNQYLEELEGTLGRPVLVAGDPTLHHQKFDLA